MDGMNFAWTDARVAELRTLFDQGQAASYIAKELGGGALSRNAVIGKLHRLGLRREKPVRRVRPRKPRQPSDKPMKFRTPQPPLERAPVPQFVCTPVPLLELQPGQCRFEVSGSDDPAKYLFCANPGGGEGCSWCGQHMRIVYR